MHRGEVEMRFGDGSTHRLGPGGLARVDASTHRGMRNIGEGEAVVVVAGGKDGYVGRDGHAVDSDGRPIPRDSKPAHLARRNPGSTYRWLAGAVAKRCLRSRHDSPLGHSRSDGRSPAKPQADTRAEQLIAARPRAPLAELRPNFVVAYAPTATGCHWRAPCFRRGAGLSRQSGRRPARRQLQARRSEERVPDFDPRWGRASVPQRARHSRPCQEVTTTAVGRSGRSTAARPGVAEAGGDPELTAGPDDHQQPGPGAAERRSLPRSGSPPLPGAAELVGVRRGSRLWTLRSGRSNDRHVCVRGSAAIEIVAKHKPASTFSLEQSDRQLSAGASRRTRQWLAFDSRGSAHCETGRADAKMPARPRMQG